jgi:DNA-binding response OmpR family regulator
MRILLAEDEKALSNAISAILKHNNFSVDAVYDGVRALEYLETNIYDALILDVMMPRKNGIAVLKELRRQNNSIPVIILTAKSELDDKVLGLDAGADDYMTKPFEATELLARLRAITRRKGETLDNILTFENLKLNRATYEMTANGISVKLGHKEFQMLEMLMLSPGRMISAETFMEKIWGFDSEAEMSSVWVYLSFLRKKLTSVNANVQIKANRNIGYSLEKIDG